MTCVRCKGTGKIHMYYGIRKDGVGINKKPNDNSNIRQVLVDRDVE